MTSVLSNNSTTAPLNGSAVFFGAWVSTTAFQAIKVSVLADQIGTLIVQHATTASPSNIVYEDTIPVNDETETFLEVIVKSAFFRVKFENGTTTQTSFKLQTTSGLQYGGTSGGGGVASEVEVTNALLDVYDASSVALLQELLDTGITIGAIDISGVSPIDGRLPTFDASGLEQLTTIAGYLDAGISVNDASSVSLLENIYEATGNTEINTTPIAYSPVHLDLETQGAVVWADSTEDWFAPLNHEQGWQYNNTTAGGANAYFYSNTSLVAGGIEPDITLGSLMNMSFVGNYRLLLDSNPNKKFYIAMTTKPTGSGDYYPGVFKSRKVYELPSSTVVSKGADSLFYAGTDITSFRRDLDHKEMSLAISNGTCGSEEIVQFMSINVDSVTPAGEFSAILKEAYFSNAGGTNRQVVFDNSIARKAELNLSELTVGMGTLQVNMGGFTFNGSDELLVTMPTNTNIKCNDAFLTHTVADTKNCLDVTVNNPQTVVEISGVPIVEISGNITADVTFPLVQVVEISGVPVVEISGSVLTDLSGGTFTDAKLNVFDLSANEHLFAIEDILETGFINTFDASANAVLDLLTFVDVDANIGNLKVIDLANNAILSQLSFFTNEDTTTDLRVRVMNQIEVINPEGQTLSVSGNVGIIADQTVGITGSVQTHNFASSNGTDWHHLHSDANGNIITLSRTHDGAGNDIASTDFGTYRALNVSVSGVPLVEISGNPIVEISGNVAVSASASQYGSYGNLANNVATILPAGVTSGIDVSDWSYVVGVYQDYYSGTAPTGFLRLQYSFDNSVYYDLFNTTISPSGSGTPRTATIQKHDIPAINWIRFKNDTNQTMASVTITLLGASLS
jgi:hypothetical protein